MSEANLDVDGWLEEFQGESDRACAVLGAAFLDEQLELVLRAFFVDDRKEVEILLRPDGAAGTFAGRARLCYCLGMLPRDQYHDLRLAAKIRNKFAHELHGLSFASDAVADLCMELKLPGLFDIPHLVLDARARFVMTVAILSIRLSALKKQVQGEKRVVPPETRVSGKCVDSSEDS